MSGLAHRDARTLFERTWSYGIDSGLITEARREAVLHEGTRAIRRIAGVLGSEFLRSDLERAMRAMLGLVNLHLEKISRGDLEVAARSIADNGLLFHTRGASRAIKRVLAAEEGVNPDELDAGTQRRFEEAVVSEWAAMSFADFAQREQGADDARRTREAARAIARMLRGQAPDPFEDPEKVVMTALLILGCRKERAWIPDVGGFEALLVSVRNSPALLQTFPRDVPQGHEDTLRSIWTTYVGKLRSVVSSDIPVHRLVAGDPGTNPLADVLALPGGALEEVEDHDVATTSHWTQLTGGTADESRLLLVMLQGVVGFTATRPLSVKAGESLLRTTLLDTPDDRMAEAWLDANAPHPYHSGLMALWHDFWEDRSSTLHEDASADDYRRFVGTWLPLGAPAAPKAKAPAKAKAKAKAKAPAKVEAPAEIGAPVKAKPSAKGPAKASVPSAAKSPAQAKRPAKAKPAPKAKPPAQAKVAAKAKAPAKAKPPPKAKAPAKPSATASGKA